MEAMQNSVYKKTRLGLNTSQQEKHDANDHRTNASMWKESVHCLQRTFYFAELFDELSGRGAFEMRHLFLYFFSLVCISEFLYTNLSSICVHISKASATAD